MTVVKHSITPLHCTPPRAESLWRKLRVASAAGGGTDGEDEEGVGGRDEGVAGQLSQLVKEVSFVGG